MAHKIFFKGPHQGKHCPEGQGGRARGCCGGPGRQTFQLQSVWGRYAVGAARGGEWPHHGAARPPHLVPLLNAPLPIGQGPRCDGGAGGGRPFGCDQHGLGACRRHCPHRPPAVPKPPEHQWSKLNLLINALLDYSVYICLYIYKTYFVFLYGPVMCLWMTG